MITYSQCGGIACPQTQDKDYQHYNRGNSIRGNNKGWGSVIKRRIATGHKRGATARAWLTLKLMAVMGAAVITILCTPDARAADITNNIILSKPPTAMDGTNFLDGRLTVKTDIGYLYNMPGTWQRGDGKTTDAAGNSTVGYGASIGYTHRSGFGFSTDYLGFNSNWSSNNGAESQSAPNNSYHYNARYDLVTFTPSYRFQLDKANHWAIRLGLGLGLSLSQMTITRQPDAVSGALQLAKGAITTSLGSTFDNRSTIYIFNNSGYTTANQPGYDGQYLCSDDNPFAFTSADGSAGPFYRSVHIGVDFYMGTTTKHQGFYAENNNFVLPANSCLTGVTFTNTVIGTNGGGRFSGVRAITTMPLSSIFQDPNAPQPTPAPPQVTTTATVKDDMGFVIAPQLSIEYDNGIFHGDIKMRYFQALKNVDYFGADHALYRSDQTSGNQYTNRSGPMAFFASLGLGASF